jgi:hypothetical protein
MEQPRIGPDVATVVMGPILDDKVSIDMHRVSVRVASRERVIKREVLHSEPSFNLPLRVVCGY